MRVVTRFSQEIRPYVERKVWHPSQEARVLADGSLELHFVTTGIETVKYWLYRWIPHVEVLEPDELRREMLNELKIQTAKMEMTDPGHEDFDPSWTGV